MRLCPLFTLVTDLHSSAHHGATCSHWGKSSGTSLGRSHTHGHTVSLLGPGGTLHIRLRLPEQKKERVFSRRHYAYGSNQEERDDCDVQEITDLIQHLGH